MFALDARSERIAMLALAALMAATRIHHFGVGAIAPDASTAVFFLAGLLLANPLWFIAFMAEAILLDAVALGVVGVAAVCLTWGYGLLFVGYLALWYAGTRGRAIERLDPVQGAKLFVYAAAGVVVFFVASNVGYYFGGGYDVSMGAAEYVTRVSRYFGHYFVVTVGYAAAGVMAHAIAMRLWPQASAAAR